MTTTNTVRAFMAQDFAHLVRILEETERADETIDAFGYAAFRRALLRRMTMEEKILVPFVNEKGALPLEVTARLHADRALVTRLLARKPSRAASRDLRAALSERNATEQGPRGLYTICDALAGDDAPALVAHLHAQPEVALAKHYDGPPHGVSALHTK